MGEGCGRAARLRTGLQGVGLGQRVLPEATGETADEPRVGQAECPRGKHEGLGRVGWNGHGGPQGQELRPGSSDCRNTGRVEGARRSCFADLESGLKGSHCVPWSASVWADLRPAVGSKACTPDGPGGRPSTTWTSFLVYFTSSCP